MTVIHSKATPRDRRRERNRRQILDSAFALVADGGLDALTINGLARAVDYTPGALYRYFPSRDALVVALQLEVQRQFQPRGDFAAVGLGVRDPGAL
jgi:AcrR family transcriptional regulator